MPARQPAYREGRGHAEFLANLPAGARQLGDRLASGWGAAGAGRWPADAVGRLVAEKYARPEWVRRR